MLVTIDVHSKWIEAIPLRKATAATTVCTLQTFFTNFGFPEEILTDNGSQFTAHIFSEFCKANGVKHMFIFEWGSRTFSTSSETSHEEDGYIDSVKRQTC